MLYALLQAATIVTSLNSLTKSNVIKCGYFPFDVEQRAHLDLHPHA